MSLGGGGSSGGGSGTSQSTSEANYPPEFRPLAKSAVEEIQKVQKKLPLEGFADYQPAGVAGLSPLQQYVISGLLPGTLNAPQGFTPLLNLPGSVGPAAAGAMLSGEPTTGSRQALQALSPRLSGAGGGVDSGYASIPQIQSPSNPYLTFLALSNMMASQQPATPSVFQAPPVPVSNTVPGIGGPAIDVTQTAAVAPPLPVPPAPTPAPVTAAAGAVPAASSLGYTAGPGQQGMPEVRPAPAAIGDPRFGTWEKLNSDNPAWRWTWFSGGSVDV